MQDLIRECQVTAEKLESRINELRRKVPNTRGQDTILLEKRIDILQHEYWDTCDIIREMSGKFSI